MDPAEYTGVTAYYSVPIPSNAVLCVDDGTAHGAKLEIKGTLSGQLTVCSKKDIWIVDDLLYNPLNFDPNDNPINDNDMLGMVANRNINISTTYPSGVNYGATDNLKVYGILMAVNGTVQVQNLTSNSNPAANKGTLKYYGGMIVQKPSPMGLVNASGSLVRGYKATYTYDQRAIDLSPPSFPVSNQLLTLSWQVN
jgi:hypothetical protein